MPDDQNNALAILIETEYMTDDELQKFKNWLMRVSASQRKIAIHSIQSMRFNPDNGGVVIYQP